VSFYFFIIFIIRFYL